MNTIKLSVHQLVDFLLRKGDIDTRIFNRSTMTEGSRIHSAYQSRQTESYLSEYFLSTTINVEENFITIEGRADGIIKRGKGDYIVEEIKTTISKLDEFFSDNEEWHLGQAKVYAFMFAEEQSLNDIDIRLVYIRQGQEKEKLVKEYSFGFAELKQFVYSLCEDYMEFYTIIAALRNERNESLKNLKFPFDGYRKGQKDLAKYSYSIAVKGGQLFCEAPTGIGKTMSTLFPFTKYLIEDELAKIFYLTAKTSGKEAAHNACKLITKKGAKLSYIVVTSKEKICFCKGKACNPDECPYAKGYYSKITSILKYAILNFKDFDYEKIIQLAYEYNICPFEFELDLSLFVDVIICDFNYMFDPISYMHRYFDEDSSHYLALIDEAHNLVDRGKDMYSAVIDEATYKNAKKSIRHIPNKKLKNLFIKISKFFNELKTQFDDGNTIIDNLEDESVRLLERIIEVVQDVNKNESNEMTPEVLDFYLLVLRYSKILELKDNNFITYISKNNGEIEIHLFCMDASKFIRSICERIKASIFFSATLSPADYYIDTLGGDKNLDPVLMLQSPFPSENLALLVAPKVSIKYRNRSSSYGVVSEYIKSFVSTKIGNYLIFLPSYEYLQNLIGLIDIDADIFVQEKEMDEQEREIFISRFVSNPTKTTIGIAIIGGAFSEGVDLVSDRLIGAVIVGIGMPKINFESDQIANYYSQNGYNGNDYAYLYPGMNKVMQAVGRVIRDEKDRGAVLLIDERYTTSQYRDLFKKEWNNYEIVFSPKEVEEYLIDFFKKN